MAEKDFQLTNILLFSHYQWVIATNEDLYVLYVYIYMHWIWTDYKLFLL